MCFSSSASFITSGGLAAIGMVSLKKAIKFRHSQPLSGASVIPTKSGQKILAVIPLLFAIQQAFEGVQWLAARPGAVSVAAGYGFLFFALLVWPTYVPITVFALDEKKRKILKWFVGLGIALTVFFLAVLLARPIAVRVVNHSIDYQINVPFETAAIVAYSIIVFGTPILSSKRAVRWFGVAIIFSALIAAIFFFETFISVWCLFAALLSSLIYFYLKYQR